MSLWLYQLRLQQEAEGTLKVAAEEEFNKGTICKDVSGRDTRHGTAYRLARGQKMDELVTEVLSPPLGLKWQGNEGTDSRIWTQRGPPYINKGYCDAHFPDLIQ